MTDQNRTAADVLKEMEATADQDPKLEQLADEFVEKLAGDAPAAEGQPTDDRPRRQRPPRA